MRKTGKRGESVICVLPVFPTYSNSGENEVRRKTEELKCFEGEGWSYI